MEAREIQRLFGLAEQNMRDARSVIDTYLAGLVTIEGYGDYELPPDVVAALISRFVAIRSDLRANIDAIQALD